MKAFEQLLDRYCNVRAYELGISATWQRGKGDSYILKIYADGECRVYGGLPDNDSLTEELLERFEDKTIEEALAIAVSDDGEDELYDLIRNQLEKIC